jgi:hypothetical protein
MHSGLENPPLSTLGISPHVSLILIRGGARKCSITMLRGSKQVDEWTLIPPERKPFKGIALFDPTARFHIK